MSKKSLFSRVSFIALCFILYKIVDNYSFFFDKISKFLSIMSPFFWGIGFAYILNPLMCFIEKRCKKTRRAFSLIAVYLIFFGIVFLFSLFIIPIITENIVDLYDKSSTYPKIIYSYIEKLPNKDFLIENLGIVSLFEKNGENIFKWLLNFSNLTFNSVLFTAFSFTSSIFNFILGVFVSIYLLYDKEKLIKTMKKIVYAIFSKEKSKNILEYFAKVNFYFYNFFIGKLIDSTIIGILCYIGFSILNVRYAILLSIVVGVFNMIPYFGPFMGAIPAVLITLLYSPIQAVWVTIFILALQQFDGWYLGPKILGNTVGASPLFIIFSILVGGGFAGPLGMLLAVPVFKSIFILWEDFIETKFKEKNMKEDDIVV